MNTAAIAKHFNVIESAIVRVEEWKNCLFCVVRGIGARFVSKKVGQKQMKCVQVYCYGADQVVVDIENHVGYAVRRGYDMGNFHLIKRFDPKGKDVRGIDFSTVKGEDLPDKPTDQEKTEEYKAVIAAISWSKPNLIAYGGFGKCLYPTGYEIVKDVS